MENEQKLHLASRIESVLFFKTEPVSRLWIAKLLDEEVDAVSTAIKELQEYLKNEKRGIVLIEHDASIMLATHPSLAPIIEKLQTREIKSDLSKAAVETLAIILYKKEATKQDIDYIRGVNSQFMLRNLMVRGLIERREHGTDKRRSVYIPSHDTLTFLGITGMDELPGRDILSADLEQLIAEHSDMFGVNNVESQANEAKKETLPPQALQDSEHASDKESSDDVIKQKESMSEEAEKKHSSQNDTPLEKKIQENAVNQREQHAEVNNRDETALGFSGNDDTPVMV